MSTDVRTYAQTDGRTDGHLKPTLLGRSKRVDLKSPLLTPYPVERGTPPHISPPPSLLDSPCVPQNFSQIYATGGVRRQMRHDDGADGPRDNSERISVSFECGNAMAYGIYCPVRQQLRYTRSPTRRLRPITRRTNPVVRLVQLNRAPARCRRPLYACVGRTTTGNEQAGYRFNVATIM